MRRPHPCIRAVRWQPKLPPMVALTYEQKRARTAILSDAERLGVTPRVLELLARLDFPPLMRAWTAIVRAHHIATEE